MSEATLTPPAVEESAISIEDGSKITDQTALDALLVELRDVVKRGLSGYRSMTTTLKRAAQLRVQARRYIVMPNGFPDWKAESDAYRMVIAGAESDVWTAAKITADEKRRVDGAIRQHVSRTFLRPEIESYVRFSSPTDATDETIQKGMAEQYDKSGLTIPSDLPGGKPPAGGGPGPEGGTDNAAAGFESAVAKVSPETVQPVVIARGLLRAASEVSVWAIKPNQTIKEREEFLVTLERLAVVVNLTAKTLREKATESDRKTLATALFNPSEETAS